MDIIKACAHAVKPYRTGRTTVHPADRDIMVARQWVLAAALAVLLLALLANAGWW